MEKNDFQKPVKECLKKVEIYLKIDQTVDNAIQSIRLTNLKDRNILYLYVLDDRKRLLGTVNARDLLIQPLQMPISELIDTKVRTICANQTKGDALLLMQKYQLLALPIIENGVFLGVIDIQDYFKETLEMNMAKKKIQTFQTLGFELDEGKSLSTWKKYLTRAPWMFCNITGGLICAVICNIYEIVLLKAIVLAMFMPLVLSLSESISMQSMTQSLHEMSKNSEFWRKASGYIARESKLFAFISISCGIFVGFVSMLWGDGLGLAAIIGSSITIAVITSAVIGVLVPLVLQGLRLDPRIASGPIVLMIVDTITTSIYLNLACWWLL